MEGREGTMSPSPTRRRLRLSGAGLSGNEAVAGEKGPLYRAVLVQRRLGDRSKIKSGNNEKREVVVPSYVPNIVKVQVYCAWAEVLLGEASFSSPVK